MLRKNRNAILLIAIGLVAAASGFWGNVASGNISDPWKRNWISWSLFGLFTIAGIMLAFIQSRTADESHPGPSPTLEQRNRQAMLNLVYNTWVEGMLHKSLYKEVVINLGLQTQPDAIENPWETLMQWPHREPELLPPGKKILQVFEEADCALLILGEPGSGKTTTLLQLAEQAIQRARNNDEEPIPVVFNLSSWASKQTLSEWLVSELKDKYSVPKKIGDQWVEQDKLMLLLDGLDEVKSGDRAQCVVAINTFLEAHSISVPICVCCRKQEYDDLAQQQKFNKVQGAVLIQPLSIQQIDRYLHKVGKGLARVYQVLKKDGDLHDFFKTPLALSILALAYPDASAQDITSLSSAVDQRKHLFDAYTQQMFGRRGRVKCYGQDQTKRWLSHLAAQLKQCGQSVFYIEDLNPGWIQPAVQLKRFLLLLYLTGVLILGLVLGLVFGLRGGLAGWLAGGLLGGLTALFVIIKDSSRKPTDKLTWSRQVVKREIILWLMGGLAGGIVSVLIIWLISVLNIDQKGVLSAVLSIGPSGVLSIGMSVVVCFVLIVGVIYGLTSVKIEDRGRPEQGIRNSLINTVFVGLSVGLSVGLIFGLIFGLSTELVNVLIIRPDGLLKGSMSMGLLIGLMVGLNYGGGFIVFHYALRLKLYRDNLIPWNMVAFLDYCADRIFLRKVGGGYIFIHRMLMEHFAAMWEENVADSSNK